MLKSGEGNAATAGFESERPAPSARLGVGHRDARLQRIERRTRFVHRPGGPRELQQRDPGESLTHDRPAVAATNNRRVADVVARLERAPDVVAAAPEIPRSAHGARWHELFDRNDAPPRLGGRFPPPPHAEVGRRSDADIVDRAVRQTFFECPQHRPDVGFRASILGAAGFPERTVHERRDGGWLMRRGDSRPAR